MAAPCVGHRLDACRTHDQARRIDLRGSFGNLDLGALQVGKPGAIVGRCAVPRDIYIIIQTGLRIPQSCAGKHIWKQGEHRQRIKGIWIDGAARGWATSEIAYRDCHRLGNKGILDFDVIRSRSPQAGRIPRVLDFVVAFVEQKDSVFDPVRFVVGRHNAGKHIPFAGIYPRGERPAAPQHISAIDFPGATGRKYEGRCNQSVGVLVPDHILGASVKHTEHPVVAREIGEIPGH